MKTITIDNKEYQATEKMITLFNRYANEKRLLATIKMMGLELGELIEIK